jgi:hypothetical protein
MLKKEIEEDRRWKDLPYLWVGRINFIEMAILLRAIYRFYVIPIQILFNTHKISNNILHRNIKNPIIHM